MKWFPRASTALKIPGLAVVVLRDTAVLAASGFGMADVERALLDLDRPMRSFRGFTEFGTDVRGEGGICFGDYACEDSTLTLRHVLSMTANGPPGTRLL